MNRLPALFGSKPDQSFYKKSKEIAQALRAVWLIWWGMVLQSKRLPVGFRVSAHAWAASSVLGPGVCKRQQIDVSLPLFLPSFPAL